jgi:hypothetical protein
MTTRRHSESGSAMVEAAIIFPCLVLILYWAVALTDVMVLKLKAAEALRYSLWESTVFKPPAQIDSEVQQRFVDLRSPRSMNTSYTGLLMYPLARDMAWKANVDMTQTAVSMGGNRIPLPGTGGFLDAVMNFIANALSRAVDPTLRFFKYNMNGEAVATVTLVRARHDEEVSPILKGGDLLGLKGGNDLDHPPSMTNLTFRAPLPSQRPMHLVFDTWKAWPKPAAYTTDGGSTNVNESPARTYPVVEDMVSAQLKKEAFFGLTSWGPFNWLNNLAGSILAFPLMKTLVGGTLPLLFDTGRMDASRNRGPVTILPPENLNLEASYVPKRCVINNRDVTCPSQRAGDVTGTSMRTLDISQTMGDGVDRTRYTIPYKINTPYWTADGGTVKNGEGNNTRALKQQLAQRNDYVLTYQCRGHFFAGATKSQQTDRVQRYQRSCNR